MPEPSFLLVGNCVIDDVFELPGYPDEDDEIRALDRRRELGGNACNSARVLAQLGRRVSLAASLGDDEAANWARNGLLAQGIDTDLCQIHIGGATPLSSIWLNRGNGSRSIVHHRDLPELTLEHAGGIDFERFDWLHFEGRNIELLGQLLPRLARYRNRISLELEKPRPGIEALVEFADTLVVSSQYLRLRELEPPDAMLRLRAINPHARVVCTLAERGVIAMDRDGSCLQLPAQKVEPVIDTIGAGDCFIAGLISELCVQSSFDDALQFANRLAAAKIRNRGMMIHDKH